MLWSFPMIFHLLREEKEGVSRFDRLLTTLESQPDWQVIAVSQATREDIINLTSIDPYRVHVVSEALPIEASYEPSESEIEAVKKKYGLQKPFWLTVGTTEPRKNLRRVISAWETQRNKSDLVIAGAAGWDNLPKADGIHFLGYVEKGELASLYRSAACLVYPSLYEGFGLPILEAYFHQCPVVTARVSSLPEAAGDAAELVDPYNIDEIAQACQKIREEKTGARADRVKRMRRQLTRFTWKKAAEKTVHVYEIAAAKNGAA